MGEQVAASTKKRKGRSAAENHIDTGTDEQQLIAANPISREVLLEITGFTSD